jgi:hypothetical protein
MAGKRGRSGRRRESTELKLVRGTFRADRHADEAQPAATGWPDPPAHLSARERVLWDALRTHCEPWAAKSDWLAFNGVVSLVDRLLRVQEALGENVDTQAAIKLQGMEMRIWRELRAFIGLTGLSPVDRARVRVTPKERPTNPLDRYIKNRPRA